MIHLRVAKRLNVQIGRRMRLNAFILKSGMRQGWPLSPVLFPEITGVLAGGKKSSKRKKQTNMD